MVAEQPEPAERADRERAAPRVSVASAGVFVRLVRRPVGLASLVIVVGLVVVSFAAPLIAPHPPLATDFNSVLSGPSASHLLGTDELGRDVLSRLLYGGRPMILAMAEAMAIAVGLGGTLGVLAGYYRGRLDWLLSAWGDLLLAMPLLVVLIVVVSVFPGSLYPAMIPLGVMLSAAPMRVVRSVTLGVREELYIDAARVDGLSQGRIMVRHVLPRVVGPIIVQCTLVAAVALIAASGLAFLGFGVPPPEPTWGSLVADAASQYQRDAWLLVPSGGVIALMVLAFGLLGDSLTAVIDERLIGQPLVPWRRSSRRYTAVGLARPVDIVADAAPAPGKGALLVVRNVCVAFPDRGTTVVDRVSFTVQAGRTTALVGESGCGKSMTARAVLGFLPPGGRIVAGSVRLRNQELVGANQATLQAVRGRRVGFVGQEPLISLDPAQTVGSALREVVRIYDRGTMRAAPSRRVLELLGQVRLADPERVARSYPHQLSGGMAQRVVIARALAGRPEIIIADEPTTALDVAVQADILALLRLLQEESGIGVLLITHDWGVVASLADEVVVMYAGQVVEEAAARSIFAAPKHPYTKALLESDPHSREKGRRLPTIGGTVPPPEEWSVPRCRFAPRCGFASVECLTGPIALKDHRGDGLVRCIRVDRVVAGKAVR